MRTLLRVHEDIITVPETIEKMVEEYISEGYQIERLTSMNFKIILQGGWVHIYWQDGRIWQEIVEEVKKEITSEPIETTDIKASKMEQDVNHYAKQEEQENERREINHAGVKNFRKPLEVAKILQEERVLMYKDEWRQQEGGEKIQEMKEVWYSEIPTIDFEKVLVVMRGLSKDFVPGGKKRKFVLDYDAEEQMIHFMLFKNQGEIEDSKSLEKMEMIKFYGWIKSFDDLKGAEIEQIITFSVQRKAIEKMLKNVPCLAEKIRLEKRTRIIVDYDPREKEIAFRHYKVETKLV